MAPYQYKLAKRGGIIRIFRFGILLVAVILLLSAAARLALAGNAFFPAVVVYINSGGVKVFGQANSENSKATAISYRSGIAGLSMVTDQPGPHIIFAADGDFPAYTQWDVGSSAWSAIPQAAGQDMYEVLETYSGMNNWVGPSYVGGSHMILRPADISDAAATPPDIVMERIPTPVISGNTQTAITFTFPGLADRDDVPPLGTWHDTVVGYSIYRYTNSATSTPILIGTVAQTVGGGGTVSYTDSTVTQGVTYYYQLAVNFRWVGNTPNPWFTTTARGPLSAAMSSGQPPDAAKFITSAVTALTTVKAGPITISSYNFSSGNIGAVGSPVSLSLSSNSGGLPRFYAYTAGLCASTTLTTVVIPAGQSGVSFCYSDAKVGSWTITAVPTNGWNPISQAGQNITVGPLDHFDLSFTSPHTNGVPWIGPNMITARDAGGNLITDFSTKGIGASVSVSNGGVLTGSAIAANVFTGGVADLVAQGFTYTGAAGEVLFTVTSDNGKVGSATTTITAGAMSSIKIRDGVGGGGNVVDARNMTIDNTLTLYAAGYDSSGNYTGSVSGAWGVTGSLESAFSSPGSSIIFAPSLSGKTGVITFDDGSGHTTETGTINVSHGALASFSLPASLGDQVSGIPFDIGPIVALDGKGNTVESFLATVVIADTTGTVAPTVSGVFVNGRLEAQQVTITKAQGTVTVSATDSATSKTGSTNSFAVIHGPLHHFRLDLTSPQANAQVWIGVNTVAAEDISNNPIIDYSSADDPVVISVSNSGLLENSTLEPGTFSGGIANLTAKVFKYTGESGSVSFTATSASGKKGVASVTINPGSVTSVTIRSAANGAGASVGAFEMQVGQNLVLYSAGYDASGNYTGSVSGSWSRTGTLDAPPGGNADSLNYQPVTAYTSGKIIFADVAGHTAETGIISVDRGPLHHFSLNFTSPQIDGVAFSGSNTILAKDVGGNTITDYNTTGSAVTITVAVASSTLSNNIFAPSDFSAGVANASAKGLTYTGTAGVVVMTAASALTQKSGTTTVTVNPGPLHHFDFSLSSTQLINVPFVGVNTLIAKDIGGNTITGFNPLVDNVAITFSPAADGNNAVSGLAGPLSNLLSASSDFNAGVADLTGRIIHPGPGGGYTFIATSASGKTGASGGVEVDVGPLHHFTFDTIDGQNAGQSFSISIGAYARDPQGNDHLKVSYVGSVVLGDDTGTIEPISVGPFVNGRATANVIVTKSVVGDVLHARDALLSSIVGDSNAFDVLGGSLDHFAFVGTVGNQTAGIPFDIGRVEARDKWDNIANTFSESTSISDLSGTLSTATTSPFSAGILTGASVSITEARPADVLTVSYLGNQGNSNGFNVAPGPMYSIMISDQAGGAGAAVGQRTISTDDTLPLYAIGLDVYGNYTGSVSGTWGVAGTLDAPPAGPSTSIVYTPTRSPQSGQITFDDGGGFTAETGTITVKHGAIARFNLSIPPSNQVGIPLVSPATLTALDAKNNAVVDFNASVDNVTFSLSTSGKVFGLGSGNNNIINTAVSFVSGFADLSTLGFVYAGPTGSVTVTASSGSGKSGAATVSFTVGPLDHFNLLFDAIQKNDTPFTGTNSIQAVDMGENPITGFDAGNNPVTISVLPPDGLISGLTGSDALGAGDFVNGVANVAGKLKFTGSKGPHVFSATADSGKEGQSSSIEILPGNLASLSIRNASGGLGGVVGNQTMKAGDVLTLWAAGYDASLNFIQDQTVSWTGTGATDGFLDPINSASTDFSAMVPGNGVIHAAIGAAVAETGTITVTAGSPTKLVFTSYPYDGAYAMLPPPPHSNNAPLLAGKSSGPIIVQAQDVVGNIVTVTSRLDFDVSAGGTGGFYADSSIGQTYTSFAIDAGTDAKTIYYANPNTGSYQITADPQDAALEGDSQTLVVVPVYSNSLVFTSVPQTAKAGVITGPITLELHDINGTPATSTDTIAVILASNSPGGKNFYYDQAGVAEVQGLNIPAGESIVTLYYKDNAVSRSLVSASAPNVTTAYQIVTITAGDPASLVIRPGPTAADGQNIAQNYSSGKIVVAVLDGYGNEVPMAFDTTVHLSSSNSTGDFASQSTGALWVKGSDGPTLTLKAGLSESHFYYRDSTLGQVTVTASAKPENNWTDATQIETIYAPVITKLAFVTGERQADTNTPSQIITVEAQDVTGNAIVVSSDTPVSLITSDPSGGSFALSVGGPWGIGTAVISAGQSAVNFYYKDATPGTKTIGVSETPSLDWADDTQNIVIKAGEVDKLAFVSLQQSIARNTPSAAIILELEDANGYPTTYTSDLVISIESDSATGAFSTNNSSGPWSAQSVVIAAGQSDVVFYYRDQQPGTYTITASAAGKPWTASQTISVTPSVIRQIAFVSLFQSIPLDTASLPITIETEDALGNPVDVAADTSVMLTSDSSSGSFSASSTASWGIASVVVPAGEHRASFLYKDITAGTFTLSASESPSKGWNDGGQQIIVGSVETTISRVRFATAPQTGPSAISGGEVSGKITIELRSALGNAVDASQITYIVLSSSQPTGRFSAKPEGPFTSTLPITILPGASRGDFYYTDTIQGIATLMAAEFPSIGWEDDTQPIEVKAGNISQLAFVTPPQTVLTGERSGVVSIEARDVYGNAKAVTEDTAILLHSNSGTGSFYADSDPTAPPQTSIIIPANQSGAAFYYEDSIEGSYFITADRPSSGWAAATQSITISSAELSSLVIEPDYALLPTNTNVQMTAIGYNAAGNPIPDLNITWSVTNPAVGTISNDGILTTGDNTGKYAGSVRASAQVTVGAQHRDSLFGRLARIVHAQAVMTAVATVEVYTAPTGTVSTTTVQQLPSPGVGTGRGYTNTPSNILLLIDDGAPETDSREVSLSLYATNASHMKLSERKDFSDMPKWLPYNTSYEFTLSSGFGRKTVYAKYSNAQGDESPEASAIISYVAEPSGIIPTSPGASEIIKKYNYVVVNAAKSGNAPALPQITSPTPNSYVVGDHVVITGSATPNTVVTLHIYSETQVVVKAVTDVNGIFMYNFNEGGIALGDHRVYASIDDTQGSLVGPAVAFNVLEWRVVQAEQSRKASGLTLVSVFLLAIWILMIIIALQLFHRAQAGRGYAFVDRIIGLLERIADRSRWGRWSDRLVSGSKSLLVKISGIWSNHNDKKNHS